MTNLRTENTFLNLDLQVSELENGYRAKILNVSNDQGAVEFTLPAGVVDQAAHLLSPAEPSGLSTYPAAVSIEAVQAFGNWLFQTVFSQPMQDVLAERLEQFGQHNGKLCLRLNLSAAPTLSRLPWEYLYYPKGGHFFTLNSKTSLVRYQPLAGFRPPLSLTPPLNVLVMIALPANERRLDADQEWARLCHLLQPLQEQGLITLDRVTSGTGSDLKQKLKQGQPHIFHFVGCMDHSGEESRLALPNDKDGVDLVKGKPLAGLLGAVKTLRLAVFSTYAYQGRPAGPRQPDLLQTLSRHALPALVALPATMTEEASRVLLYTFYYTLANGAMVDEALCRARNHILAHGNDVEWGAPHLHLCYQSGRIFDIAVSDGLSRQHRQMQHFYNEAVSAFNENNLSLALEKLRLIQLIDPAHPEARTLFGRISRYRQTLNSHLQNPNNPIDRAGADLPVKFRPIQLDIEAPLTVQDGRFNRVEVAFVQRDWQTAVAVLQEILDDNPDSVEAAYLLQWARQQAHLNRLYAEGRALYQKGNLTEALSRFQMIQASQESARLGEIIQSMQTAIQRRADHRQVNLLYRDFHDKLYAQAKAHYYAREYRQALTCLQRVQQSGRTTQTIERLVQYLERVVARQQAAPEKKPRWVRLMPLTTALAGILLGCFIYFLLSSLVPPQPPLTPPATRTHSRLVPVARATPTPILLPTFTPTIRPQCLVLRSSGLNLRNGPGTVYESQAVLSYRDVLLPLGRDPANEWIQAQVARSGQVGWVSAAGQYVGCNVSISSLSLAEIPPLPTATATPEK